MENDGLYLKADKINYFFGRLYMGTVEQGSPNMIELQTGCTFDRNKLIIASGLGISEQPFTMSFPFTKSSLFN
jgi:hypothetical protein